MDAFDKDPPNGAITPQAVGFSFIELSIALVVIGILVSVGFNLMNEVMVTGEIRQTREQMEEIRDAIEGFVVANHRLPCPDINGDGDETTADTQTPANGTHAETICTAVNTANDFDAGALPHVALGLPTNRDVWGNVIQYAVYARAVGVDETGASAADGDATGDLAAALNTTGGTTLTNADFCTKLSSALTTGAVATDVHIARLLYGAATVGEDADSDCATGTPMAFILASPGPGDADLESPAAGLTAGSSVYDGLNSPGGLDGTGGGDGSLCYDNPERQIRTLDSDQSAAERTDNYDDVVMAGSIAALIGRLNCN